MTSDQQKLVKYPLLLVSSVSVRVIAIINIVFILLPQQYIW